MAIQFKLKVQGVKVGGKDFFGRWESVDQVINQCRGNSRNVSIGGVFTEHGIEYQRSYSVNKVRRKFVKFDKPKKWTKPELKKNGHLPTDEKYTYGKEAHPTHWVGIYYNIPTAFLKFTGMKVVQGRHSYKLVPWSW